MKLKDYIEYLQEIGEDDDVVVFWKEGTSNFNPVYYPQRVEAYLIEDWDGATLVTDPELEDTVLGRQHVIALNHLYYLPDEKSKSGWRRSRQNVPIP